MTPWEWSMAAVVLGPMLAVIAMWFLAKEQAQTACSALFVLVGAAGVLASGYGVVATEPFLLPTDVFFTMVATFDKFSAMFFFPFALVVAALGMRWYEQRTTAPRTNLQVIGVALVVIGVTWAFLSTNILGIIAAFMTLVCGEACLTFRNTRTIVLRSIGVIAIATGFFILSSGALFNDLATLAYIAAELDSVRLIGAFIALLFGVAVLSGGWPLTRAVSRQTPAMHAGAERALIRSAFVLAPLYLFIRALLFILPPLSLGFAVSVSAIGVLTILSATHFASKHRAFSDTTFVFGAGVALFMLSSAMTFQALSMFEAMNVALFATLLHIIGIVLSGSAEEFMPNTGVIERTAVSVALLGLPPSVCFVSVWMFVSGVVVQLRALPEPLAVWLTIGTLFLLGALVRKGYNAIEDVRTGLAQADRSPSSTRDVPFLVLAAVSTLGAVFVPFILSAIGATPLTIGAETWLGAVIAGDGLLSTGKLLLGIVGFSAGFWVLRDKTATTPVHSISDMPKSVEFAESRFASLRREMYKVATQHIATPVLESVRKFHAWHDPRASKPVSPAIGLMLLTVILTLAIAL